MRSEREEDIIIFVNALLEQAVREGASDIHLEPLRDQCRIRMRVQGCLYATHTLEHSRAAHIIRRIKVLAHINMSERREPHDGAFQFTYGADLVDARVSLFPSLYGVTLVLRILDRRTRTQSLDELGMHSSDSSLLRQLLQQSNGAIITSGPTGAGKTTTLYACLPEIVTEQVSVITLEDPVEYAFEGITQGYINPQAGLGFEAGLRALLRQDPDVILLGEIRDSQTACTAMHAALTGHLLLSSIHARDTINVIMRLLEMGVEPYVLNACLSAVIAQRLVQTLCQHCKESAPIADQYKPMVEKHMPSLEHDMVAHGCSECHFTGVAGRRGIFEFVVITDQMRNIISEGLCRATLMSYYDRAHIPMLIQRALELAKTGYVSLHACLRAVGH